MTNLSIFEDKALLNLDLAFCALVNPGLQPYLMPTPVLVRLSKLSSVELGRSIIRRSKLRARPRKPTNKSPLFRLKEDM